MTFGRLLKSRFFVILLHISVWAVIFILPLLFERGPVPPRMNVQPRMHSREGFQLFSTLMNFSFVPLFYFNAFVLVPRFFSQKKWPLYALLVLLCVAAIAALNVVVRSLAGHPHPFPPFIRIFTLLSAFILFTSTAYSLIELNIRNERMRKEKESENLKTELSFLRSQVSPHFLFNTLNNLVSLARKKSDLLEPALLKLSGLLQYMLYESDYERISIHKEAEYLNNYVELQKLRFRNMVTVTFYREVPESSYFEVVPMILIPFVENAFKHGVVFIEEPEISIRLVLTGNILNFTVTNKYSPDKEEKDKSSGIGLVNVKRRLNLLYPDCVLRISTENNIHIVNLLISL